MENFETPDIQVVLLTALSDPVTGSNDLGFVPYGSESGYEENTLKVVSIN